ncbi:MAG: serine/threonine-protein kinase [Acidobacteriota bacterium]|nr:serine/threonine protein kinase [Blastocatellia bacterium]MDW8411995.1 serine/threonine-protein kinase [Acidobacteriota bacterium]
MKECFACKRCFGDHNDFCDVCGNKLDKTLEGLPFFADRYRMDSRLGSGTFGMTYSGYDIVGRSNVAIKVILAEYAAVSPQVVETFEVEAAAATRVYHPNIVRVLNYGQSEFGFLYLIMELLIGKSLDQLDKPLEPSRAISLLLDLCCGLELLHRKGRLHGDVKPSNVFVVDLKGSSETVKLLDAGLWRMGIPEMLAVVPVGKRPSASVMSSAGYMSPERFEGEDIDERCDVYSAVAVMYYLLTGRAPYTGTYSDVIRQQSEGSLLPPSQLNPAVPEYLEQVVLKGLDTDIEERFQSVVELAAALKNPRAFNRRLTRPRFAAPDFDKYIEEKQLERPQPHLLEKVLSAPQAPPPPKVTKKDKSSRLISDALSRENFPMAERLQVSGKAHIEMLEVPQLQNEGQPTTDDKQLPKVKKKLPPPPPHEDRPEHYLRKSKESAGKLLKVSAAGATKPDATLLPPREDIFVPSRDSTQGSLPVCAEGHEVLECLKRADEINFSHRPLQASAVAVVYLFADKFMFPQEGRWARQMHGEYYVDSNLLAASLLTTAVFSLRKRGSLKISPVGTIVPLLRKKLDLSEEDKFVLQLVNGTVKPVDLLERVVLSSLGRLNACALSTVFLNFAVAAKQRANCSVADYVCDVLANELVGFKILERRVKSHSIAGKSAYYYRARQDELDKAAVQLSEVMQMLLAFKNEPLVVLGNKKIVLFDYIVDYYHNLFLLDCQQWFSVDSGR